MASNQIEEVKSKTDIVSLISEYIEVKKAGRNYKALCPFHGEKTPSFMITPELQIYKCFACGESGDCFTFLEKHEGMEFSEALNFLAEKAGVKLVSLAPEKTSEREKIISINKSVLNFYNYALLDHPQGKKILEYLTKTRGLTLETIKKFKLGFSPESFDALPNYLKNKKKFTSTELTKAGLLVGRGIDRFRGRVIFPLFDHRDNCIGFAGRILPWHKEDLAKYINSPDTEAYHKSKVLYGLNITKSDIRNKQYAIVVEGELDMISSYQAGIKNIIAIKGSALTEDQIRLLGRFLPPQAGAKQIVLCLDSDFAGNEAAKRGAILAVNLEFDVKVATLVNAKDPDEIARNNPEEYRKNLNDAVTLWDFLIDQIFNKYDSGTGDGKAKISREVIPLLGMIQDNIVRAFYIEKIARRLSVPTEAVNDEVQKLKKTKIESPQNKSFKSIGKSRRELLEEKLLVNAVEKNIKILFKKKTKALISSEFIKKIIKYLENNPLPLPSELQVGYGEMVLSNSEKEDIDLIIKELITLDLKERLKSLGEKIKTSDDQKLLKKFSDLSKKLSAL